MGGVCPQVVDHQQEILLPDDRNPSGFLPGIQTLNRPVIHHDTRVLTLKGAYLITKLLPIFIQLKQQCGLYADPSYRCLPLEIQVPGQKTACIWNRMYLVFEGKPLVDMNNQVELRIKNSDLGYFYVFLMFLSRHPELVRDNILTNENSFGLAVLKIFLEGQPSEIIVDDRIICTTDNSPAFIEAINNEQVWPFLYEKAWMKIKRSIPKIFSLSPKEPFLWFLNLPLRKVKLRSVTPLDLCNFLQNNPSSYFYYFKSLSQPEFNIGLEPDQYFSLVRIEQRQRQETLFFLKECTGCLQFRGTFSDSQTPDTFPLSLSEVLEQFSSCTTIYYYQKFRNTSVHVRYSPNSEIFIKFNMSREAPLSISILKQNQHPDPLMMDLVRLDSNTLVSEGSHTSIFRQSTSYVFEDVIKSLQPGEYLLRLVSKSPLKSRDPSLQATITFYTEQPLLDITTGSQHSQLFASYLLEECERQYHLKHVVKPEYGLAMKWQRNRLLMYVVRTDSSELSLRMDIKFPQVRNLSCINHLAHDKELRDLSLSDTLMLVFEKDNLSDETELGNFEINCERV